MVARGTTKTPPAPPPQMAARHSVRLHRCRFLDWSPSPITALAFPPALLSSKKLPGDAHPVLAVGRANGNIEIWRWASSKSSRAGAITTNQGWVMHQALYAPRPSKVDALAFAWKDPSSSKSSVDDLGALRLFSTTGGTLLFEWDLLHGSIRRSLPCQGGAIWCLAANPAGSALAIGCEDGCVRLVDVEGDEFVLKRKFDRVKTRILSIAWGPPLPPSKRKRLEAEKEKMEEDSGSSDSEDEDEDEEWLDEWLVTGCSDSSLRKWDVKSGRALERMSTDRTRSEPTLVWAVGVLSDGTIVSGDSMGNVKFWDRISCTQLHSFQSHGADVLCLAISRTNNAVYTSGVDQKVTEFLSVQVSGGGKQSLLSLTRQRRWIQSCSRRLHSHDVRCLAIWPAQSLAYSHLPETTTVPTSIPPILVSAGLDMSPVFIPCAAPETRLDSTMKIHNPFSKNGVAIFEDAHYHRTALSASPVVCFANKARLLACWVETKVSVWRLGAVPSPDAEGLQAMGDVVGEGWEKVLDMELRVKSSIVCCALSQDGRWLTVSDVEDVKLFRLQQDDHSGTIEPKRVKSLSSTLANVLSEGAKRGATSLIFSPDSKKLILGARHSGVLIIVGIDEGSEPRVLRTLEQHRQIDARARLRGGGSMEVDPTEKRVTPEISRLAVSPDGQWLASGDLSGRVFVFNLDSLQHHCTLPTLPYAPTALAFDFKSSRYLLLAMPNNTIKLFDVESKSLPNWQRALSEIVSSRMSAQRDAIIGALFVPSASHHLPNTNSVDTPMLNGKTSVAAGAYQSIIIWGANWLCRFRLYPQNTVVAGSSKRRREEEDGDEENEDAEEDTDEGEDAAPSGPVASMASNPKTPRAKKDRIRGSGEGELFLTMFAQYRNLLGVDFLNADEMVVVERPLLDVLSTMPPAYFKAKYGT